MVHHETAPVALEMALLFHDIGKFWQGQHEKPPTNHPAFGAEWFEKTFDGAAWSADAAKLIGGHHDGSPAKLNPLIVKLSDWLSSMEREERTDDETGKRVTEPLRSVFQYVNLTDDKIKPGNKTSSEWCLPLQELSIEKNLCPSTEAASLKYGNLQLKYKTLWSDFEKEVSGTISSCGYPAAISETMLHTLKKYTSMIPSATYKDEADISLFDHLRTTCAIGLCLKTLSDEGAIDEKYLKNVLKALSAIHKADGDRDSAKMDDDVSSDLDNEVFTIIGGDLSGIQGFIYDVASLKGATKMIRGRSLYVRLACEAAASFIAGELGLPAANILYNGGGRFYILAPKTGSLEKKLETIRLALEEWSLSEHRTDLSMTIGTVHISAWQLRDYGAAMDRMGRELEGRKLRKFSALMKANPEAFFGGLKLEEAERAKISGTDAVICSYCNQNYCEDGSERKCGSCDDYETVGGALPKSRFIVEMPGDSSRERRPLFRFTQMGICYVLCDSDDDLRSLLEEHKGRELRVYSINDTGWNAGGLENVALRGANHSFGFIFAANEIPASRERGILNFDELADEAIGAKKLAFAKMDVDNLGMIFSRGLPENKRTISRVSTMSSQLDFFFCGQLNARASSEQVIYLVYSGGDDVFFAGPWDALVLFASKINDEFRKFMCENPQIHLSAGITITPPKYPLRHAAKEAADCEETAKSFINQNGETKNAVFVFGKAMNWSDLSIGLNEGKKFEEFMKQKKLPKSFIYFLQGLNKKYIGKDGQIDHNLVPILVYHTKRHERSGSVDKYVSEKLLDLRTGLDYIKSIHVPANWACMRNR